MCFSAELFVAQLNGLSVAIGVSWLPHRVLHFGHTHPYQLSPPRSRLVCAPNLFILNLVILNIFFILSPVILADGTSPLTHRRSIVFAVHTH
ncbi:hypothetical protein C8R45DRAFT_474628 [Mycena sanguinolenta]|nr:hypothetical protein C8R45DRAFT_474628 [Mycena sanguinolenta]